MHHTIDSITDVPKACKPVKLTASGIVGQPGPVAVIGYTCESSASGVITLFNNLAASGDKPSGTGSKAVAAGDVVFFQWPILFDIGCYMQLVSGSATVHILTVPLGV